MVVTIRQPYCPAGSGIPDQIILSRSQVRPRLQLITVISCSEREGADGKVRKVPERQPKEVIPVTVPTPKADSEPEFEYVYQDEGEPVAEGDIDCGVVEASEIDSEPQKVDWKIKH